MNTCAPLVGDVQPRSVRRIQEPWLQWVQLPHSIGQAGLNYSTDLRDRERFEQQDARPEEAD